MKATGDGVSVSILGKEYKFACAPDEREALRSAAALLDRKMREVQEGGRVLGAERCAVMAALNLANEVLQAERASAPSASADLRLQFLCEKIDNVLKSA